MTRSSTAERLIREAAEQRARRDLRGEAKTLAELRAETLRELRTLVLTREMRVG